MYVYWILYLVHIGGDYTIYCSHAPRGACELKLRFPKRKAISCLSRLTRTCML